MATIDEELLLLEAQLQQWRRQLEALAARGSGGDTDAESERLERIDDLRAKHQEARAALADAQSDRGEKTTNEADGTWGTLESKFFRTPRRE